MIDPDTIKVRDSGVGYTVGTLIPAADKNFTFIKQGALVVKFDGLDNMLEYVTKNMPHARRGEASANTDRDDFNSFNNYEEALETFRNHPEKVVEFNPAELRIKDESESGQTVDYDVVGDYIDMGRYMEGIPESWGSMRNGNARNRRVNITVNLNQTWNIHHRDVTHRGERILRLVDALEAGGVRTQLTVVEATQCGWSELTIKKHEEPLTISDLAVASHPEFLRRVIFRINEHSDTWDWGYGNSRNFSNVLDDKPQILHADSNDEINIFIDGDMRGDAIDKRFDEAEKLLVWEMSKPQPEVDAIKIANYGLYFSPNGARSDEDIIREGKEAINAD